MSLSNYPAGVTGHEPMIAGPAYERDEVYTVAHCYGADCEFADAEVAGVMMGDRWVGNFWWECPECGHENETEFYFEDDEYEPDFED